MTTSGNLPWVSLCGRKYRWGVAFVECLIDPNISKSTTVKERVVTVYAESQSISRDPNRTRFLTVQVTIPDKMECDKKSLFTEADAPKKWNLMLVGCWYKTPIPRQGTDYVIIFLGTHTDTIVTDNIGCTVSFWWRGQGRHSWCIHPRNAQASSNNLDSNICWSVTDKSTGLPLLSELWCHMLSVCVWALLVYRGMDSLSKEERLDQKLVEKLVLTHTNLMESLDDSLRHLLPWDIELV